MAGLPREVLEALDLCRAGMVLHRSPPTSSFDPELNLVPYGLGVTVGKESWSFALVPPLCLQVSIVLPKISWPCII